MGNTILHQCSERDIRQACIDSLLTALRDKDERIADLENSLDTSIDLNTRLMRALARILATRQPESWYVAQEKKDRIDAELRGLRAMALTDNFEDGAAVISAYASAADGTEAATIQ